MVRTLLRITSCLGLTLFLGFAFTPLGCGGSNAWTVVPSRAVDDDPHVPPATFSAVLACATEAKGRLTDRAYRMRFDVEVTESGEENRVKLRDSSPGEHALEACVGHALEGMELPLSVLERVSTETSVSPASRGLMGQGAEEAVGAVINMASIHLAVAAVAVVVVVGVHYTGEAIDAARRRRREARCQEMYEDCTDRPPPCTDPREHDYYICSNCRSNCVGRNPYYSIECTQCGFRCAREILLLSAPEPTSRLTLPEQTVFATLV